MRGNDAIEDEIRRKVAEELANFSELIFRNLSHILNNLNPKSRTLFTIPVSKSVFSIIVYISVGVILIS
jgi:hypothetical protein